MLQVVNNPCQDLLCLGAAFGLLRLESMEPDESQRAREGWYAGIPSPRLTWSKLPAKTGGWPRLRWILAFSRVQLQSEMCGQFSYR